MNTVYFDDLFVGRKWVSPSRTVTESDVGSFAGLTGDFFPLHTDETYAAGTRFGTRIAHGLLGLAFAHGLMWTRTGEFDASLIAFLGISDWRFTGPVYFGDTIRCRYEVAELRVSQSNDQQGIVVFDVVLLNQRDESVQFGSKSLLIARRSAELTEV